MPPSKSKSANKSTVLPNFGLKIKYHIIFIADSYI